MRGGTKLIYWLILGLGAEGGVLDLDLLHQDNGEVITQDNGEQIYVG